jgi:hypothetical protein
MVPERPSTNRRHVATAQSVGNKFINFEQPKSPHEREDTRKQSTFPTGTMSIRLKRPDLQNDMVQRQIDARFRSTTRETASRTHKF